MTENTPATPPQTETVAAGHLPPWQVGEMPAPPDAGWRLWVGLLGPGVVLAGTSIGSGEWLFGPAVSAQYGATLMWLASISIVFQKLTVAGAIREDRSWQIERMSVTDANGAQSYRELNQVPDPYRKRFEQLTENRGLEITTLFGYVKEYGKLPPVDWAILAAFIAIAGAGGMSNTLFSNYARDKGWGMGKHVGAIPSAIGGRMIKLSHVGMVAFRNVANRSR